MLLNAVPVKVFSLDTLSVIINELIVEKFEIKLVETFSRSMMTTYNNLKYQLLFLT